MMQPRMKQTEWVECDERCGDQGGVPVKGAAQKERGDDDTDPRRKGNDAPSPQRHGIEWASRGADLSSRPSPDQVRREIRSASGLREPACEHARPHRNDTRVLRLIRLLPGMIG